MGAIVPAALPSGEGRAGSRLRTLLCCIALGALSAGAPPARAAGAGADFSFEQLASMEVSGISKSAERVIDAPAAVTVISGSEIRDFGFRTIADILNAAPGFFTYSDRAYSYVGVRGFAPIESYNSRILLLVDGFPSNDGVYQQALIGSEGIVDLDLIDRVEIIPGPSSSVYGTNAFLGVVNIILKGPSGVSPNVRVWAGSGAERGASAAYSGGLSDDTHYLLQASGYGSNGLDIVFAPQPAFPAGARLSGLDGSDDSRVFAKLTSGNLRLNLGFSDRRQASGFGLYGDVIGDPRSFVADSIRFGDLHYEGALGESTDYVLRASAAEYRYDTDTVDAYPPNYPAVPGFAPMVSDWVDAEATATHHVSADNRLIFGLQARRDLREDIAYSNDIQGTFLQTSNADTRAGIYAQSDIDWSEHWATSAGLRLDADTGQPVRVDPRVALLWKPTPEQALKLMWGTAFRDPSFFETNFQQPAVIAGQPALNLPNPRLASERLHTLDLNYVLQLGAANNLSVTAFRYAAADLISEVVVNPAGTLQYQNSSYAQARGADLALDSRLLPDLRARLSAEYADARDANGNWEQNSPHWTARLGLDQRLPADWQLAGEGLFEGRRLAIDNSSLPDVLLANVTLSSPLGAGRPNVSLGVYNLFDRQYGQPVAGWAGDNVNQPARTWRITVGYVFR